MVVNQTLITGNTDFRAIIIFLDILAYALEKLEQIRELILEEIPVMDCVEKLI